MSVSLLAGVVERILGEGQQNCLKSKNYTGNNLLGLYVSRHSTFRMGSATLIERERETGKRERKAVTNKSMIYEIHPSVRQSELIMYAQQ